MPIDFTKIITRKYVFLFQKYQFVFYKMVINKFIDNFGIKKAYFIIILSAQSIAIKSFLIC